MQSIFYFLSISQVPSLKTSPIGYAPNSTYEGAYRFTKHYYDVVGDLKNSGEEFECAKAIDMNPRVKYWVRNLERSSRAFRLPTSTDYFYPDFIVMLDDGRVMVIEYKGDQLVTADDAKEKLNVGQLWEERDPNKKSLFLMAVKTDANGRGVAQQIAAKL